MSSYVYMFNKVYMKVSNTKNSFKPLRGKLFFLIGLFVLSQFSAFAQPQYSVGSTTSGSNSIPFGTGTYNDSRCQMLYLPSDFGTVPAGMAISTIYFVPSSTGSATFSDIRVDIGQDNITSLSSSSWVSGLTTALSNGSYTFTRTTSQWWALTLDNPIPYDPTKPLIIDVRKTNTTSSISIRTQTGSGNRRAWSTSSTASSPSSASTTMYTFGFDLVSLAPDNAGISELVSPVSFCRGNQDIKVNLRNSGTNTLSKVTIDWELDGVAQPTINWTGSLASQATETITLATGVNFTAATKSVKAWTSGPNGLIDTVAIDDTLTKAVKASLNGIYTVGASGSDFTSVKEAADTLMTYGVCGPVTIDIADGTYTDQVKIGEIPGISAINRVTFKSRSGIPANVIIDYAATSDEHVLQIFNSSYLTIKDVTVRSNGTNAGRVVVFDGSSSYDSIVNCMITASVGATSSNTSGIYGIDLTGSNNVILNNTINGGYYGIRWEGVSTTALSEDNIIDGNTINNAYYYSTYLYYLDNLKFRNNTINAIANTTHYGINSYYCDNSLEITGNRVTINGTSTGTHYGLRVYYDDGTSSNRGLVANNVILINNTTSTAYGIYMYYSKYQDVFNNTVNVNSSSSSTTAARFYFSSSTYNQNTIRNNVFSNTGTDGTAMYIYRLGYDNSWDYNNIYSVNQDLVEEAGASTTYQSLSSWRVASGEDMHSISYDPGFMSNTSNLEPDVNNPATWSLNGRAEHQQRATTDILGNARKLTRASGVSDIGAFEFEPNVAPPLATALPNQGTPGTTQEYEFGGNIVATIDWGSKLRLTSPLEVRQYSGRKAPNFNETEFMYFYTDVKNTAPGKSFDYSVHVNYMDIWLGTISAEANMKLAHKMGNSAWIAYNSTFSVANVTAKTIDAVDINNFGSFTGIMDGVKHSALVKLSGASVICTGDSVTLTAYANAGTYTYQWKLNGVDLSGINTNTVKVSQAGDYSVVITDQATNTQAESMPVSISVIAPPNALVNANGPLTYCNGGTLQLSTPVQTNYLYQWQLNGNDLSGETSSTIDITTAGDYTVRVTNLGCEATSTTMNVTAGPLTVDLGNDISRCEIKGQPVQLNAGYPGAKFTWSTGDTTQTAEVNRTGTYWVQVDAGPNCIDIDTIEVTLDPLPSAKGISYVRNGNTFAFSPSGDINADSYMWIFGDGTQSFQRTVTKSLNGDIFVRLVMFNACGSDTLQIGWPLNVSNTAEASNVKVYPNPATDYVVFDELSANITNITVTDMMGKTIQNISINNGRTSAKWNTNDVANGVYFYTVYNGTEVLEKGKVVVRR